MSQCANVDNIEDIKNLKTLCAIIFMNFPNQE